MANEDERIEYCQPLVPSPIQKGERELITGLLSKDVHFRLLVSGNVGVNEIDRLIKKLELDKEILAGHEIEEEDMAVSERG